VAEVVGGGGTTGKLIQAGTERLTASGRIGLREVEASCPQLRRLESLASPQGRESERFKVFV
jgi:hypothetical protein